MIKTLGDFGVNLHKAQLKNGSNVFLFQRKGMPIYIRTIFFAGSRFDAIPGVAHFLEHMLLAGTKKFPKKNLIAEHIQRVGGDFGASTSPNSLRINIEIPEASDLSVGIEVLNEIINESLFDPTTIENERGSIVSEFQSKLSNPKEYVNEVSRRLSLQSLAAGQSTLGGIDNIQKISVDNLLGHKNRFLTSGRVAFIVSGGVEPEELLNTLEQVALPISERFEIAEKLPITNNQTMEVVQYPGTKELQVVFSCRTSIENYKEYCALKVLNDLIGNGRGSRLITRLRYENGLVYNISSSIIESPDWGIFSIKLSCDKNNFQKVKEIIFEEFESLIKNGVSESKLEDTKTKISKGSVRHSQTSESWVDSHETQSLFYPENLKTLADYIETVNSITNNDLQEVINKYLKRENFVIAICGDYLE